MWKEFRDFIARGNAFDLAVAVVIGAAFGKIVDSLVKDIIMPPIGLITGGIDFSNYYVNLKPDTTFATLADAQKAQAPTINYGVFLNNVIGFLIIAFVIFILVKQMNRLKGPPPAAVVKEKDCPFCKMAVPLLATRCGHCTSALQAS